MPGKKISLIGSSNLHTNRTCQFGSMAGLAPTKNVRPWISAQKGYKVASALNVTANHAKGCGYNKMFSDLANGTCANGRMCVDKLSFSKNVVQFRTGGKLLN